MLNQTPELLLRDDGVVVDFSRKPIQGLTPFQAALCAGDELMCQKMMDIAKQRNMEADLRTQFTVIFPDGDVEAFAKRQEEENTFNFDAIAGAIDNASDAERQEELAHPGQNNPFSALNQALNQFRQQFAELSHNEKVFNPSYLLAAFERYDERFNIDFHSPVNSHNRSQDKLGCPLNSQWIIAQPRDCYAVL